MRRGGLFGQIYGYLLLVTLGAMLGAAWYGARALRQFYHEQVADDLLVRARIVASNLAPAPERTPDEIDGTCKELGRLTGTRITVVAPDGRVLADSAEDPAVMENHGHRPEIAVALSGETGRSIRYSDTLRCREMYLAVPWRSRTGELAGVVRTALPLEEINGTLRVFFRHIALGGAGVAALIAVLALYFTRRITQPLKYMRQAAEQFAQGDLTARVPVPDMPELGVLARTVNQMAAQLSERMQTIALQSNEQTAILDSMMEGVVAVDLKHRILHINRAAARLLGLAPEAARGRHILEAVRNIDLQEFLGLALASSTPVTREIVLHGEEEQFIQLCGTAWKDAGGAGVGVLVVMNDVTHLKRLETMRRDFVANVSHELKTPLTAIKGCVDTLAAGALRDPEQGARFLEMMGRQVTRLELLVDDVLSLSRLEHESERGRIALEPGSVREVLARVVQGLAGRAEARRMRLVLECAEDLRAPLNGALLEQAVGNLVDNAIKYGPEQSGIMVTAATVGESIEIRVADEGPGIEKKHLSRIFERFYRVDTARQRALGGTGLGLAIVKHIALAHHGSVSVESAPGRGSVFTLRFPRE